MIKGIKKAEMECEERAHRLKSQLIELVLDYGRYCVEYGDFCDNESLELLYKAEEDIMKYIGILKVD